jgi:hypothetical protein
LPPSAIAPPAAPRLAPISPAIAPGFAILQARSPPIAQSAGRLAVFGMEAGSPTVVGAATEFGALTVTRAALDVFGIVTVA